MRDILWQIALTDALLICIAASIGWWFRSWISKERDELLSKLEALQEQQQRLQRVCDRLELVSNSLEWMSRSYGGEEMRKSSDSRQEPDNVYAHVCERLERGHTAVAIAKDLQMRVAEVELLGRMMRLRRR